MKTILLTLTYLVGVGELILAIYFWVTHSKSEIRKVMALFTFATAGWVLMNATTAGQDLWIIGLTYVFGVLLLTAQFHFTLLYPYRLFAIDRLHVVALYMPWTFFTYAILFTHTVTVDYPLINNAAQTITGPLYPLLTVYMASLYLGSILIMLTRRSRLDGTHKKLAGAFVLALIFGGLPGFLLGIFHSYRSLPFNYLYGPIFSSIWLGTTTYIVRKK